MAIKNTIKTEIVYLSSLQFLARFSTIRLANCTDSATRINKNTILGVFIYSWAHGSARAKRMANTQMNKRGRTKTDIFNRVFALRLVIVYQGLVRIPESEKINFRQVRPPFNVVVVCG
jgi:hypothetical protein